MSDRSLIVNADDFGLSEGVNRGIVRAHEQGIVTSASLMVRQPAARAAAEYARSHHTLSVGLHLDLGEWAYQDGEWVSLYQVVPADDPRAVSDELHRQLDAFVEITGSAPTHLDSHQHAHLSEPARSAAARAAERLNVPLRNVTPGVRYCGSFFGQLPKGEPFPEALTVESLVSVLSSLPPGVTELACHPGDDPHLRSAYRLERLQEVATLCDPAVRATITRTGIHLINFRSLGRVPAR